MEPDGVIESNWTEIVDSFDEMELKEELLRGVYGYGFERPSAIQQRAILPCIRERDVIAQAQSGKCDSLFTLPDAQAIQRELAFHVPNRRLAFFMQAPCLRTRFSPRFLFAVFVNSSILDDKTKCLLSDWAR